MQDLKVVKLTSHDMKVLEDYIRNLDKLRYKQKMRKLELMDKPIIDNFNASKPNLPSDPVNREVTAYLADDYYRNISKIIKAVEEVYNTSDEDVKRVFDLSYFHPKLGIDTWQRKADYLYTSKTTLLRIREKYLCDIANRIDYVNTDF